LTGGITLHTMLDTSRSVLYGGRFVTDVHPLALVSHTAGKNPTVGYYSTMCLWRVGRSDTHPNVTFILQSLVRILRCPRGQLPSRWTARPTCASAATMGWGGAQLFRCSPSSTCKFLARDPQDISNSLLCIRLYCGHSQKRDGHVLLALQCESSLCT
jgi:hypothetical protein